MLLFHDDYRFYVQQVLFNSATIFFARLTKKMFKVGRYNFNRPVSILYNLNKEFSSHSIVTITWTQMSTFFPKTPKVLFYAMNTSPCDRSIYIERNIYQNCWAKSEWDIRNKILSPPPQWLTKYFFSPFIFSVLRPSFILPNAVHVPIAHSFDFISCNQELNNHRTDI